VKSLHFFLYIALWLFFAAAVAVLGRILGGKPLPRPVADDGAVVGTDPHAQPQLLGLASAAMSICLLMLLWGLAPAPQTEAPAGTGFSAGVVVVVLLITLLHIHRRGSKSTETPD
jgi:hypothetical protein